MTGAGTLKVRSQESLDPNVLLYMTDIELVVDKRVPVPVPIPGVDGHTLQTAYGWNLCYRLANSHEFDNNVNDAIYNADNLANLAFGG